MRKVLIISGIVFMLVLLVLGPKMVNTNSRNVSNNEAGSSTPGSTSDGSSNTTPSTTTDTSGTSTYNVQPVTLPNGSISYPTYTTPTGISSFSGPTTSASPDPSKCTGIRAQITAADATLVAQDLQLQTDIKNYQSYLTNMAQTMVARGYGYTTAEQASISNVQSQLGIDQGQLNANLGQINTLNTPYNVQLAANECG